MGVSEWKHGRAIAFCMDNVSSGGDVLCLGSRRFCSRG